eukprot:CAMPEP_0182939958 /NCGR_PEP_ID=MMETSP0105_2-20130417/46544_1 /TAXON_ID=81532 ORGANISM="Acanthoeca-like sp., Strain 10tr" /NCGR_SAMPLE_ID=MMETSP0105_2 /ASSEMBLY_ACC=CAM_ASM_000205 /LENGTH=33 /DNA_ID= /DNA_START= /DNA_END= /DNA_ORIENTATION=
MSGDQKFMNEPASPYVVCPVASWTKVTALMPGT